jgi:hypothetical protein
MSFKDDLTVILLLGVSFMVISFKSTYKKENAPQYTIKKILAIFPSPLFPARGEFV